MKISEHKKKSVGLAAAMFFTFMGIYNSVVINSESTIVSRDLKFVKRLDEAYGVVKPGRIIAASKEWRKLEPVAKVEKPVVQVVKKVEAAPEVQRTEPRVAIAAVEEELNLGLVEVVNPRKWKDGVKAGQFAGSLVTNNGIIEALDVSLPNDEGISVSFSELSGNVFEYDMYGELYSGMLYQVDQNSYMVTLTNGPLEGTRLRFSNLAPTEPEVYAQDQIEAGNFGNPGENYSQEQYAQAEEAYDPEAYAQNDRQFQMEGMEEQGFNLDQNQAM